MGLGLTNSQRGPWALDCPTAYNDSKRVTVGLSMVSEGAACRRQQKRQLWVSVKAVRQERGTALSQQPSSRLPAETDSLTELGREIKALKSPQASRVSERGGRTDLHTSKVVYVSHPSSSASFGGVYPTAAHTGLLPREAECPEESKGLSALLCPPI